MIVQHENVNILHNEYPGESARMHKRWLCNWYVRQCHRPDATCPGDEHRQVQVRQDDGLPRSRWRGRQQTRRVRGLQEPG